MTYTPTNASTWKNRFNKDKAHWDDLKRIGRFIVPLALTVFIMLIYGILYISLNKDIQNISKLNKSGPILSLFLMAFILIAPNMALIAGIRMLFRNGETLLRIFYKVPTDMSIKKDIRRRLLGVPPAPSILKWIAKYPFITIKKPELERYHFARWFGGPATLVIYDGVALYIERGNKFSRVLGPGLPMPHLDRYETIREIVDLRPQIRESKTDAWTKDGIQIKLNIRVEFQIYSSDNAREQSKQFIYPFDPIAVKTAVERTAVKYIAQEDRLFVSNWKDASLGTVQGTIKAYIAARTLDDIFSSKLESPHMLSEKAMSEIEKIINNKLKTAGTRLLNLEITDMAPENAGVSQQRINYWSSIKEREATIARGQTKANGIRMEQEARLKAQRDMLNAFIKGLEKLDPENFTDPAVLFLSQILQQDMADPMVKSYITKEAFTMLEKFKSQLGI